jgi:hypothetical protein
LNFLYGEFERFVKENGKKVEIAGLSNKESVWEIENLLVVIDEYPILEEDRIVTVIDLNGGDFFYIIYLSPLALKNGAREFFGIIDWRISSKERLFQIFKKIKRKSQGETGFFNKFFKITFLRIIAKKIIFR